MQAGADLDAALIDASRNGDRTAFAQIIERYHRAVYAVSFSSVRDRTLADDITQDTFVTAWRRFADLRDATKLPAWLCGIARNLGRDARKRIRRETVGDLVEPIDSMTPYEALSEAESERLVAVALGQIPDVYREPLVLYYYEERSVDDVARSLGISAATTNKRLSRGRQYLAERVATIVEGAIVRRGPSAALVASVLAVIGTLAPAHVDASPVKGSTMNKLGIAAAVTAAVGGVVLIVAVPSDGGAATTKSRPAAGATANEKTVAAKPTEHTSASCATDMMRALSAPKAPSLTATSGTASSAAAANDCATVGRHLAELEGDATHGPDHRPDEAQCEACASVYTQRCESGSWSVERRNCTLAASDLFNA
ncbi:MAG: RNA polymerase sigma factor, partial [Deltaproteobacteria bacterium]|nr:RNA polymerase sigma factor [Deltaproteobacteria bacterium]